ncbi:hypothetical protein Axy20_011 [Achromobacter phage vB_AxyS_19-32_Axy20]|nr:hypothetical protein Axy20_011 [Achromobacter phage vB_AxyS_19-32_Axy20]
MNLQAEIDAAMQAAEEFKNCKRNKSGSLNGNARFAIIKRLVGKLQAAGVDYDGAWKLAFELARKLAPR